MPTTERLADALADRYRLERELGAGGMATVHLAHDLKHDRKVAIKVLKPELAAVLGAERFVQEIKTTAALSHPHILPLFDSGEADGFLYYVMPYIEGETIRETLNRETQFGIEQAVRIATEVADALDYAHRHGVVHRDIKPENILLHDGRPMVMDFGIALAVSAAAGGRMTETGLSLGTPHYMSPEQATADKAITGRSDIYSLASVLYEMLTGTPPHVGGSAQQIIMKIIAEPVQPVTGLRKSVPMNVAAAVSKALEKLPADRFASAREFAQALADPSYRGDAAAYAGAASVDRRAVRQWQYVAAVAAVVALGALVSALRRPAVPARVVRFTLPAATTSVGFTTLPAVSPDGRAVAYADYRGVMPGILVRWIDRADAEMLPGTESAIDATFSPDSKMLAYITPRGEVRTVGVDGRTPTTLIDQADASAGISWGSDGYIYYPRSGRDHAIARVSAGGGQPEDVVVVPSDSVSSNGAGKLGQPQMLDDGRTLLATAASGGRADGQIVAIDVRTKARANLAPGIVPLGVRDGWLLYARADGSIQAQRFDASARRVSGTPVPVLTGVYVRDARAFAAVGRDGTLFYRPATSAVSQLVWVSRGGVETLVDSSLARPFIGLALAPQGGQIAVAVEESNSKPAVWLYDLGRRTFARLTKEGELAYRPQWSPDGKRVLFASEHGSTNGTRSLYSVPIDGSDTLHLLVSSARHAQEISWPPAGRVFAFREGFDDGGTLRDIYTMAAGDTVARAVIATKADEFNPAVSPDGRWLAYVSNESGRNEVYLTPFPKGGPRLQVSNSGGASPVWARNGRELYYRSAAGAIVGTDIDANKADPAGASRVLFDASRYYYDENGQSFDIAPDGSRFLLIKAPPRASIEVVLGWWSETTAKLAQVKR